MQFEELTLAHIKARTEEVGDCWIWQQRNERLPANEGARPLLQAGAPHGGGD